MNRDRTVQTVGDLGARHLGFMIRIPDLHQPGEDWDAPKVTVIAKLVRLSAYGMKPGHAVQVELLPRSVRLEPTLFLSHPCFLVSEDPKQGASIADLIQDEMPL